MTEASRGRRRHGPAAAGTAGRWRLEQAKARFSALVRAARAGRAQHVTVHGKEAVVVLSAEAYRELIGRREWPTLHALLSNSPLRELQFEPPSERSPVREIEL